MAINIQEMTIAEKLMTMEFLWDDLCENQIDFTSPDWHESILKDREKAIIEGKDKFVDWVEAKKEIINSIS